MMRLFLLLGVLALAAAGCGGNTSCDDACRSLVGCLDKLDPGTNSLDVASCTSQCNAGSCAHKQQLIDCVHGARCDTTADAYDAAIVACQLQSSCSIGG